VWHASVTALGGQGPILISALAPKTCRRAQRLAIDLLAGVGMGEDKRDRFHFGFHLRRRLAPAELAMLDPVWCAIPALDLGGDGEPW